MRLIGRIANLQLMLAMLALLAMGVVTACDVFLKYVFSRPIIGTYDLVESLLPVVIFHGLPATLLRRQTIVIDLIDHFVDDRGRRALIAISDAVVFVVLILITWALVAPAGQTLAYGDRKIELGLPLAVIWGLVIAGMAGVVLAAMASFAASDRQDTNR
jgi:TRAP-type C4-dicarboxylate transport system permease small subunit